MTVIRAHDSFDMSHAMTSRPPSGVCFESEKKSPVEGSEVMFL